MKSLIPIATAALLGASPVTAQEVVPIDPVTATQGLGALGTTTAISIVAGVVTVAVLVAGEEASSSTGTN